MKPLDGVRVLDFSRVVSGPVCCFYLASLGAEVIRIEQPGGDVTWPSLPQIGPDGDRRTTDRRPEDIGISALRKHRGKRSVVIDVRDPRGVDLVRRLAASSDVLVENYKPGVLDDMGIRHAALRELNPRLVVASITGYGQDGPYRNRPAMDLIVQAVSGLMSKTGFPDGPPTKVGLTIGDQLPAALCAIGVLAALRQRDLDGEGQVVEVAMLDALIAALWDEPLDAYAEAGVPERIGNTDPRGAPLDTFATTDGWVAVVVTSDAQFARLAAEMDRPDLLEQYPTVALRGLAHETVNAEVGAWLARMSTDEAVGKLEELSIPGGPVQPAYVGAEDPQVRHRGALVPLEHPMRDEPTRWLGPAMPVRFSRADTSTGPTELLGASTAAVLAEVAGVTQEELDALAADGILPVPPGP